MDSLFDPKVLYEVLHSTGLLPQWAKQRPYNDASGEYDYSTNRLVAPPGTSTVPHEMTHAVQHNILKATAQHIAEKKWNQQPVSDQEERFLKAASTIFNEQYGRMGQYDGRAVDRNSDAYAKNVKGIFPHDYIEDPKYQSYRKTPVEMQAYGVGDMTRAGANSGEERLNPHLAPSLATDFSVLLGMYSQLPKTVRDSSAKDRLESIESTRKQNPTTDYKYEDPFYKDPFGTP